MALMMLWKILVVFGTIGNIVKFALIADYIIPEVKYVIVDSINHIIHQYQGNSRSETRYAH